MSLALALARAKEFINGNKSEREACKLQPVFFCGAQTSCRVPPRSLAGHRHFLDLTNLVCHCHFERPVHDRSQKR